MRGTGLEAYETAERGYHGRVLFLLSPHNPIRRFFIHLIEHVWFDRVVLLLICANCVLLAMQQPWEEEAPWANAAELAFQCLFTIEFVCKVAAMGLAFHKGAYLRDGWNWVDVVVVVFGWLSYFPTFRSVSAMRSVRVLRPLRTIQRVKGMRVIISSLLDSIPMMGNVLALFVFAIFLFGVVGELQGPGPSP